MMSKVGRTIESIVYNKVPLTEFLRKGGFDSFPGISVSKKGWIYVRVDDKTAPLMLDVEPGAIRVRGCYKKKSEESSHRLLAELPDALCTGANRLFKQWNMNVGVMSNAIVKTLVGNTYINYKHCIEAEFPITIRAFSMIPMFYNVKSAQGVYSGISLRIPSTSIVEFDEVSCRSDTELESDDDIVTSREVIQSSKVKVAFTSPSKACKPEAKIEAKPELTELSAVEEESIRIIDEAEAKRPAKRQRK